MGIAAVGPHLEASDLDVAHVDLERCVLEYHLMQGPTSAVMHRRRGKKRDVSSSHPIDDLSTARGCGAAAAVWAVRTKFSMLRLNLQWHTGHRRVTGR